MGRAIHARACGDALAWELRYLAAFTAQATDVGLVVLYVFARPALRDQLSFRKVVTPGVIVLGTMGGTVLERVTGRKVTEWEIPGEWG